MHNITENQIFENAIFQNSKVNHLIKISIL